MRKITAANYPDTCDMTGHQKSSGRDFQLAGRYPAGSDQLVAEPVTDMAGIPSVFGTFVFGAKDRTGHIFVDII